MRFLFRIAKKNGKNNVFYSKITEIRQNTRFFRTIRKIIVCKTTYFAPKIYSRREK